MKEIVLAQLKRHEGFSERPYKCTRGKTTIGFGRNLDQVGISKEEAEVLLENDIEWSVEDSISLFPNFKELSPVRQAVLVNMMFNLGKTSLSKFIKFRAALEEKDFDTAAREMLNSRWAHQVGSRSRELAEIMRNGI